MATKLTTLGAPIALLVLVLVLVAGGGSSAVPPAEGEGTTEGATKGPRAAAIARLKDADGNRVGVVRLIKVGDEVEVRARVRGVTPAGEFHGFHVHATGKCNPNAVDPATGLT